MDQPLLLAVGLGTAIGLLGLITGVFQVIGLRQLAARKLLPSDERDYLRTRHRRRILTGAVLVVIGTMIAGAYLSGMEARADAIGDARIRANQPIAADGERPPISVEDRQFVRLWGVYWIVVILLVFALVGLALVDAWASRRYWMSQYRQLKEEHQTRLRRDLEVYRQHKQSARAGRFNRGGDASQGDS